MQGCTLLLTEEEEEEEEEEKEGKVEEFVVPKQYRRIMSLSILAISEAVSQSV